MTELEDGSIEDAVIERNSWHYKFMLNYTTRGAYDLPKDFCTYWRVLSIAIALYAALAGFLVYCGVSFILFLGIVFGVIGAAGLEWVQFGSGVVLITIIITVFLILIELISRGFKALQSNREPKVYTPKPTPLWKIKYRSWKGKYCPKLTYK